MEKENYCGWLWSSGERYISIYEQKEHVTLPKLLTILKDDGLFSSGYTNLRLLLKDMGFHYCTCKQDDRSNLAEAYLPNRVEKRLVVFLDEIWAICNSHDGKDFVYHSFKCRVIIIRIKIHKKIQLTSSIEHV